MGSSEPGRRPMKTLLESQMKVGDDVGGGGVAGIADPCPDREVVRTGVDVVAIEADDVESEGGISRGRGQDRQNGLGRGGEGRRPEQAQNDGPGDQGQHTAAKWLTHRMTEDGSPNLSPPGTRRVAPEMPWATP
jgi:hypothetical protein